MEKQSSIQENFLPVEEFNALREQITAIEFPWFFTPNTVNPLIDKETTTGLFGHSVYINSAPNSEIFPQFYSILHQMDVSVLTRIKVNLQPRLPKPDFAVFHSDTDGYEKAFQLEWTTSILYINTCNGFTELEEGEQNTLVESVENRLVTFPSNIKHRGISQTDEQTRILINFNYLKLQDN